MTTRRGLLLATAVLAGVAALGAMEVGAHGGEPSLIHACVDNASGALFVVADPTPYGNPRAGCPRPTAQHALDWGVTGPRGPQGPAGPEGPPGPGTAIQVFESERTGVTAIGGDNTKIVGALAVVGPGNYQVSAKLQIQGRLKLDTTCALLRGSTSEIDDSARATAGASTDAFDPEQTLHLQQLYRVAPGGSAVTSIRVRCRNDLASSPSWVRGVTVHALKVPFAAK